MVKAGFSLRHPGCSRLIMEDPVKLCPVYLAPQINILKTA